MYAVTSMPLLRRTRAILRSAELGFLGVCVVTRVHTPRFCGEPLPRLVMLVPGFIVKRKAGALVFLTEVDRPLRTSWLIVGIISPLSKTRAQYAQYEIITDGD